MDTVADGSASAQFSHTYAAPGTYTATATAASGDEPGPAFEFTVVVAAAEDNVDDLADTGFESAPALAAGAMLVLCGTALLLMTRTQRPVRR